MTKNALAFLSVVIGCVLSNGGCKGHEKQVHRNSRTEFAKMRHGLDGKFLKNFYRQEDIEDNQHFVGPSYLSKRCTRITPIENGKTTIKLPPADNSTCPIGDPKASPTPVRYGLPEQTNVPAANSVGRLELEVASEGADEYYLWATAFKVGESKDQKTDLVATTCHALEPVVQHDDATDTWVYGPGNGEKLWIDLGERTGYPGKRYEVTNLIAYGRTTGLDVAFLSVKHTSGDHIPPLKFSIKMQSRELTYPIPVTVIGYIDFQHPVDPLFDLSYGPFMDYGDAKFVSIGRFSKVGDRKEEKSLEQEQSEKQQYLLHDAATSMGESGSPVFPGEDLKDTTVIGVHVCCTAYWQDEKGNPPINYDIMPCARIQRSGYNKAVSSADILKDKSLCSALYDYGGLPSDYKCPQ